MRNKYIQHFEDAQMAGKEIPQFKAGDTLRVGIRISEGDKTRIQNFEGICISLRGVGTGKTFTIEKSVLMALELREFSLFIQKVLIVSRCLKSVALDAQNSIIYALEAVNLQGLKRLENNLLASAFIPISSFTSIHF